MVATIAPELKKAQRRARRTDHPEREFADFCYRPRKSWTCERRVIGKVEWTQNEANPRFIVTNVHAVNGGARFSTRPSTVSAVRWKIG